MRVIEADFASGRFLVRVGIGGGRCIRLLADTGGGLAVDTDVAGSLPQVPFPGNPERRGVRLPLEPSIPGDDGIAWLTPVTNDSDGVLGARWLADRVWSFDYVAGRLALLEHAIPSMRIPMAFRELDGMRTTHFPRIQAVIDGATLDLLLDTGATIALTDQGLAGAGGLSRYRAISFITHGIFERWRSRHPDWPVIQVASRIADAPVIRVPQVIVGDSTLGPVWFERRADRNFHEWMSQWMDRQVEGALGGNAFAGCVLILDYPNATAAIEQAPAGSGRH